MDRTVIARGSFSHMRELERVLKKSELSPLIEAPPGCDSGG